LRTTLGIAVIALVVTIAAPARAEDASRPVNVVVTDAHPTIDLRAVLADARPAATASSPEVRLDGALFAGLASAGLVVVERPGEEAPLPRPVAGVSPRLLRGGGVACDVRVSF
jgi:hypothetical protein